MKTTAFVLGLVAVTILVMPAVGANNIPANGPHLGGSIARDGTVVALWYYGYDGSAKFAGPHEVLPTKSLHVITYQPASATRHTGGGTLVLNFTWWRPTTNVVTVHENNTTVQHEVKSRTIVWQQNYTVAASQTEFLDTAIALPEFHNTMLTISYRNETLRTVPYNTSIAYSTLPPQTVQTHYLDQGSVFMMAGLVALIVVGLATVLFHRGDKTPPPRVDWALIGILMGLVAIGYYALWSLARDTLLRWSIWPMVLLFGGTVGVAVLQVWRSDPETWLTERLIPTEDGSQPRKEVGEVLIAPVAHEDRPEIPPELEDIVGNVYVVLEDTWGAWISRAVFGHRTYLVTPRNGDWWFETPHSDYDRCYILRDELPRFPRPRGWHVWTPPGKRLPRLRHEATTLTMLPVAPFAAQNVEKFAAMVAEGLDLSEKIHDLTVKNARLEAQMEAKSITHGKRFAGEWLANLDSDFHLPAPARDVVDTEEDSGVSA